eukprot:gene7945-12412_t
MTFSRNIIIGVFALCLLVGAYIFFFQSVRLPGSGNSDSGAVDALKNHINELNQKIENQKKLIDEKNLKTIPTTPTGVEKQLVETKRELDKLKKQHDAHSKIHHLKVVVISKDDIHANTRTLVGSIHKIHTDIKVVIYGLKLHPNSIGELKLWANVEYIDIDDFIASNKLKQKNAHEIDIEIWKPVVMRHAAQRYGKILYVDNKFHLTSPIYPIEKYLEQHGSVFFRDSPKHNYIHCHKSIQGYKFNGFAYNNILVPSVACSYKICPKEKLKLLNLKDESKIPADHKDALKCLDGQTQFSLTQGGSNIQCHIRFRDDFLYSLAQLPTFPVKPKIKGDPRTYVALGFPSTSKGIGSKTFGAMPPFKLMIPSLLRTINKGDKNFLYNLYLGFDIEDPYYDNEKNQQEIIKNIQSMTAGYPITFTFVRCRPTYGWTSFLWNAVFQHAMKDSNDYFYQINDDLEFRSPGWTEEFINKLKSNPVKANLGVVGPRDDNNPRIFTQSFVHKTHHDIFGYYYPPVFRNWYSDDWITTVYNPVKSSFKSTKRVFNSNMAGTRYQHCGDAGSAHLAEALGPGGKQLIEAYLADHK